MNEPTYTRNAARRPQPRITDPAIQWATGLTTNDRRVYAGWFVEANKDEALDAAMQAAQIGLVTIKHGNGTQVTHWALPTARLLVVCDGVQSMGEMREYDARYGIAFGWATDAASGRRVSRLRARVLLAELAAVGYYEPLLLTLKGTVTGDFLDACAAQYQVLHELNVRRAASGKPAIENLPFYACALPVGPGEEVQRGSGGNTKTIFPPVALIPDPITAEYIKAAWTPQATVRWVEALVDATVAWSITESKRIANGDDGSEDAWRDMSRGEPVSGG